MVGFLIETRIRDWSPLLILFMGLNVCRIYVQVVSEATLKYA